MLRTSVTQQRRPTSNATGRGNVVVIVHHNVFRAGVVNQPFTNLPPCRNRRKAGPAGSHARRHADTTKTQRTDEPKQKKHGLTTHRTLVFAVQHVVVLRLAEVRQHASEHHGEQQHAGDKCRRRHTAATLLPTTTACGGSGGGGCSVNGKQRR
jgi:hypothetical protein